MKNSLDGVAGTVVGMSKKNQLELGNIGTSFCLACTASGYTCAYELTRMN